MNQLPGYCGLFEGRQGYMMFAHNIKLVEHMIDIVDTNFAELIAQV